MSDEQNCGRLDDHERHPWSRPARIAAGVYLPRRYFTCPGPPVIEGGHPTVRPTT